MCVRILKYMGDYPSKRQRLSTELTDTVFESPLTLVSPCNRPHPLIMCHALTGSAEGRSLLSDCEATH